MSYEIATFRNKITNISALTMRPTATDGPKEKTQSMRLFHRYIFPKLHCLDNWSETIFPIEFILIFAVHRCTILLSLRRRRKPLSFGHKKMLFDSTYR